MSAPSELLEKSPPDAALTTAASSARVLSLDVYRGLVMFLLAFQGFGLAHFHHHAEPGTWLRALGDQFEHVSWRGCVLWDMIQPSFLFVVGAAMEFSCTRRRAKGGSVASIARHLGWRSVILIAMGVALTAFKKSAQNPTGGFYPLLTNVLCQIGLATPLVFLCWNRPWRVQTSAAAALLVVTWGAFAIHPLPTPVDFHKVDMPKDWPRERGFEQHWDKYTNFAADVDCVLLNQVPRAAVYSLNPGGYQTLNFVPSAVTMILGLCAARGLSTSESKWRKAVKLLAAGAACVAAGWLWDASGTCPIVKRIWTPSWTLFSGGLCLAALAGLVALLDGRESTPGWTLPFVVAGSNSILLYVLSLYQWAGVALIEKAGLGGIFRVAGESGVPMLQAIIYGSACWLICYVLYRHRCFFRI